MLNRTTFATRPAWLLAMTAALLILLAQPVSAYSVAGAGQPAPAAYGDGSWYTVKRGDTLFSLARRYGTTVEAIVRANNLKNANHIRAGQKLWIPGSGGDSSSCRGTWYTVAMGDTLFSLAKRYGTTVEAITRANGLKDPYVIKAGQKLCIPGGGGDPSTPVPPAHPGPWTGLYYGNPNLSGSPVLSRADAAIDFNWGAGIPAEGVPADLFSVLWTGSFRFGGGNHRFFATSKDGVRIFVDNMKVLDAWRDQPPSGAFVDVPLSEGVHALRVEYYNNAGDAVIRVWWQRL